ncbi:DUF3307 domain-containing protein [Mesobacillus zeae]|uniref:DUF3307 domain-containing protein n=1 Tax=Mesobacillus zeae TaxID=1917180 RepID=UPI0015E66C88|nr:DUF3307 domain-containing protein [Mesobacillus zeae]
MLVLSLVIAHLAGDFLLQTDRMLMEKKKYIWKHIIHHFLLSVFVLQIFVPHHWGKVIFTAGAIGGTHLIIDLLKIKLFDNLNQENLKKLWAFLFDQLLHLTVILGVCHMFLNINMAIAGGKALDVLRDNSVTLGTVNSILFTVIIVLLATSVSGHIVRILLGTLPGQLMTFEGKYSFRNKRKEGSLQDRSVRNCGITEEYNYMVFSKHDLSRGKLIGYLERLLVILLTFYSAYPAIGFIVAAKSIARFKQLDDRDWAEYFLLGTLASMLLGIALGILLREAIA